MTSKRKLSQITLDKKQEQLNKAQKEIQKQQKELQEEICDKIKNMISEMSDREYKELERQVLIIYNARIKREQDAIADYDW